MPVRVRGAHARNRADSRALGARTGARAARPGPRVHGPRVKRGSLVAFEGIDGCGKSTQCERLARALGARGVDVVQTREPTDGPFGRRIRSMARSGAPVAREEELAWFVEDRRAHVRDEIEPALARGAVVLCDRYFHSTVAYQGARGFDPWQLLADSEREFPSPDLVLYFAIDVRAALARVRARGGPPEPAFERADFLERVAAIFEALAAARPAFARIDATGDEDAVAALALRAFEERLPGVAGTPPAARLP